MGQDAGEIKAKVTIEYDGSGLDKAKEGVESLADIAGGELTSGVSAANDALSGLDEQMGKSAESTRGLTSSVSAMEKPLVAGENAITSVSDALGAQQAAISDTSSAYEDLQKPLETATTLFENASPPMMAITEHARSMQEQMSTVSDGFASIGESLTQSVPLLPQFAENLHSVSEEFDPKAFGLDDFTENMGVFQDALSNPYPFQMIQQHLKETGQTWDDFSSSIGDDNTSFLQDMATNAKASNETFGSINANVQATGKTFYEATGSADEFTKQFASLNEAVTTANKGINSFGGVGSALYGPEEAPMGFGEAFSGAFGGIMEGLNKVAMPLMAVQMIGQVVAQVGQGIYNMAAIAEGPAAHSVGTFTGTVDALGQSVQKSAGAFSEGFGQGVLPTLNAMNYQAAQGADSWGAWGKGLGMALGIVGDVFEIGTGLNPVGGFQGLANTGAQIFGMPEPFQGPAPASQSSAQIQAQIAQIPQQLAISTATMQAQANNPTFLAAQAYLGSQTQIAQQAQLSYTDSHYGGTSGPMDPLNNIIQSELIRAGGGVYGGNPDPNAAYFNSIQTPDLNPTCFPAGTRVLMVDDSERAIETLQIGEQIKAHDGTKQVTTTILATIKPPPKRVYELVFDTGNTLTLTDSHPISTVEGWKSLSPEATQRENPDLVTSTLQRGDRVHTINGLCTLIAIQPREIVQVYNLTVDDPHTFYANSVLVHNKISSSIMQQVADVSIPPTNLKNSNLIQSLASNFSGADMTHTFTATVNWAATGLEQHFTGQLSWAAQGLEQLFTGQLSWAAQGLEKEFMGKLSWAATGLEQLFTGKLSWAANGLEHQFEGLVNWVATGGLQHEFEGVVNWVAQGGLQHTFQGAVDWVAQGGLQHTFQGLADWIGQGLQHTFTAQANWQVEGLSTSFTSQAIPQFAAGVQNFGGGLAVVGERGPELVHLPQGASVYPQTPGGFPSINTGDSGMVTVHVTHVTQLDGQIIAKVTIPYIAPMIRQSTGRRSA